VQWATLYLTYFILAAFRIYLHKVKEMKFDQTPDYNTLISLFRELYYKRETYPEILFCWTKKYVSWFGVSY